MIDERARELERRAKQGDPDAARALRRERERTGCNGVVHGLTPENLTDDEQRLANAHDAIAAGHPNGILALRKTCEVCGEWVRIDRRGRA